MNTLQLYSIAVCPFAQRTKIALTLKGIPHEVTEFDISKPMPAWFQEMNPEERVRPLPGLDDLGRRNFYSGNVHSSDESRA
jgi:glutathionyl-hydroquinone reductase